MYYVYMLRCYDNTLYTGITTNVERRFQEHLSQGKLSAKYTKVHKVKKIEAIWQCENRHLASQLEYYIKKLTKPQKEKLIQEERVFWKYFKHIKECDLYQRIDL